jgi:hypothetical protein
MIDKSVRERRGNDRDERGEEKRKRKRRHLYERMVAVNAM